KAQRRRSLSWRKQMSTIRRRRRSSRMNLGPYRRHELLGGVANYPVQGYDGYGDGHDTDMRKFISDEMRRDWTANRGAAGILEIRQVGCRSFSERYVAM